jgi:hypothetical protein
MSRAEGDVVAVSAVDVIPPDKKPFITVHTLHIERAQNERYEGL